MSERRAGSERTTGPMLGPDILIPGTGQRTLSDEIPSGRGEPTDPTEAAYPGQPGRVRRLIDRLFRRT